MSIATKLAELTQIRTDIRTSLIGKGISASTHDFADFSQDIDDIQTGGGARLPAEYQEVEWVGSSGTQRIETGIYNNTANVPIAYVGEIAFDDTTTRQLIGSQGAFYIGVVLGYVQFGLGGNKYQNMQIANGEWVKFNAYFSGKTNVEGNKILCAYKRNGSAYSWTSLVYNEEGLDINNAYQVCLFSLNGQNLPASCKHKDFIIYQNSVLVRHLVPCYRKADTEIGFYDLVNNQFYTNAGTGTFTKGADV